MRCLILVMVCAPFLVVGCGGSAKDKKDTPTDKPAKSESEIQEAFGKLVAAVKSKDVDKIWSLLANDSLADVEREAKAVKEAFAKLPEKDRPEYEKKVGLSARELTEMNGKLYVKSKTFFTGETGELAESKFEKVVVTGESAATIDYREDEGKGQRETRSAVREDGRWKFVLPISKAVLK